MESFRDIEPGRPRFSVARNVFLVNGPRATVPSAFSSNRKDARKHRSRNVRKTEISIARGAYLFYEMLRSPELFRDYGTGFAFEYSVFRSSVFSAVETRYQGNGKVGGFRLSTNSSGRITGRPCRISVTEILYRATSYIPVDGFQTFRNKIRSFTRAFHRLRSRTRAKNQ